MNNSYGTATMTLDAWLDDLDALPTRLRRKLDFARVPIGPEKVLRAWRSGMSETRVLRVIAEAEADFVRASAIETYGADHPDARAA